jgi:hypothetical protein
MSDREIPRGAMLLPKADIAFALAPEGSAEKIDRFHIDAYSGGVVPNHWLFGDLVVDLAGLQVPKKRIPVLLQHDDERRVGYTTEISVSNEAGVAVEGTFLKGSEHARQVLSDARESFPWEASIWPEFLELEDVPEGTTLEVNGFKHTFKRGGTVVRKSRLREVSFVALGADNNTAASALNAPDKVRVSVIAPSESSAMTQQKSDPPAEKLSLERLMADHAELFASVRNEGQAAGVTTERERMVELFEAAPDMHRDLALRLLKDGTPVKEGLKLILADDRKMRADRLSAIGRGAGEPLGVTPETPAPAAPKPLPEGPEKWKQEFAASADLQKEFGSEQYYLSYKDMESRGVGR